MACTHSHVVSSDAVHPWVLDDLHAGLQGRGGTNEGRRDVRAATCHVPRAVLQHMLGLQSRAPCMRDKRASTSTSVPATQHNAQPTAHQARRPRRIAIAFSTCPEGASWPVQHKVRQDPNAAQGTAVRQGPTFVLYTRSWHSCSSRLVAWS